MIVYIIILGIITSIISLVLLFNYCTLSDKDKLIIYIFLVISMIIIATYNYIKLRNAKDAIKNTGENKLHCGSLTCPEPPIQKYSHIEYTPSFLINLVHILSSNQPIKDPKYLKTVTNLITHKNDKVFGNIWTDKNGDYWIAFRGTQMVYDIIKDVDYNQSEYKNKITQTTSSILMDVFNNKLRDLGLSSTSPPKIHTGFSEVYDTIRDKIISTLKDVGKDKNIYITGHSLGAAVATICHLDIGNKGWKPTTYVFAPPRVGNNEFATLINNSNGTLTNLVNTADIIPTLPVSVSPNFKNPDDPFIFSKCGKTVYFTDNWKSIYNNHILPVYIQNSKNLKSLTSS
jgi:hypothetical protein